MENNREKDIQIPRFLDVSYKKGYREGYGACLRENDPNTAYLAGKRDGRNEMARKAGKAITVNRWLFLSIGALIMLIVVLLVNAWQYHMGGQWKVYKDFPIGYGDTASQLLVDIPAQISEETGLDIRVTGVAADDMKSMHYIYAGRHVFRVFIKQSPFDVDHNSALIDIILVSADDYY